MLKLFQQSYPIESLNARLILSTFISLFVFLFLAILEPFHINLLQSEIKLFIIAGYGLICWISLLLFYVLLPTMLLTVFNETNMEVEDKIDFNLGIVYQF